MSIRATIILSIFCIFSFLHKGNAQSPYTITWKKELYSLGAGGLAFGIGIAFAVQAEALTEEEIAAHDRNNVNAFDRGATYNSSIPANTASDILLLSTSLVPLTFLTSKDTRKEFGKIAILYGETVFITMGLTTLSKEALLRSRPLVYNEDFSLNEKTRLSARHAFISGHAALTAASCFFTAKVFSDYFPDSKFKPYVWAGAIAIPALTGYLRVAAGKHFPTDVIAGYAVGATIGILIPHLHRNVKIGDADSSIDLVFGGTGASLTWKLN
jgi:membrane-associated phospholipid phosphatase